MVPRRDGKVMGKVTRAEETSYSHYKKLDSPIGEIQQARIRAAEAIPIFASLNKVNVLILLSKLRLIKSRSFSIQVTRNASEPQTEQQKQFQLSVNYLIEDL